MVNIGTTIARPFAAQVQLHSRAEHMLHFHDQPGYSVHPSIPKPLAHPSCLCVNEL